MGHVIATLRKAAANSARDIASSEFVSSVLKIAPTATSVYPHESRWPRSSSREISPSPFVSTTEKTSSASPSRSGTPRPRVGSTSRSAFTARGEAAEVVTARGAGSAAVVARGRQKVGGEETKPSLGDKTRRSIEREEPRAPNRDMRIAGSTGEAPPSTAPS